MSVLDERCKRHLHGTMMSIERELSELLFRIGAVRFGRFTLKDGRSSPFYVDLRILVSHPAALARVARALVSRVREVPHDRLAGIPYAGLPIAVAMSLISEKPLLYARKETKNYGTRRQIEGEFHPGERVLVVDDVLTSGLAKVEAIGPLREAGLRVDDVAVVVDREDRGAAVLKEAGLRLHSVLKIGRLLDELHGAGVLSGEQLRSAVEFLA